MNPPLIRVGLISDTHNMLRPSVHTAFAGVDLILHAGDVGDRLILDELETIAPVRAVYGNTDAPESIQLSYNLELELNGTRIHLSHGHEVGAPTPEKLLAAYDADVIVYGHTHRPLLRREGRRVVVNPGAAGARRFDILPSVAILVLPPDGGKAEVTITELDG